MRGRRSSGNRMLQMTKLQQKILPVVKKYRYFLLMLVLGIGILLLPGGESKEKTPTEAEENTDLSYAQAVEQKLEGLLSLLDGAGDVRVMLTLRTGTRTVYQIDRKLSSEGTGEDSRSEEEYKTVILSEGSAYDKAAVSVVEYPGFQGALILAQGAELPAVRLALINAVSALTGLNSGQITVVKMK